MEDQESTKYVIHAQMEANGVVERPDVVGAIFGQTEGLVGKDLDLRDLQKKGKVGRINVKVDSKGGRSKGTVHIPTSLGKLEASVLAASLETIERIGPCKAEISVTNIEDVRSSKREQIANRAQELVTEHFEGSVSSSDIEEVIEGSPKGEVRKYHGLTAGPNVGESDAILVVEGRSDVLNLLRNGVKNAVAVSGTDMPSQLTGISNDNTVTAFLDGDRGGELILKELLQRADIDYVARAPDGKQVEELEKDEIMEALRDKVPAEEALGGSGKKKKREKEPEKREKRARSVTSGPKKSLKSTFLKNAKQKINRSIESSSGEPSVDDEPEADEADGKTPEEHFDELKGSRRARLLDESGGVLEEVEVGDLMEAIRDADNGVASTVMDGIITQRLLDIAADRRVGGLVGAGVGEVVHRPTSVDVKVLEG